jgi:metal-responsive CopG/Arc/MetJ family transcriptional regulator
MRHGNKGDSMASESSPKQIYVRLDDTLLSRIDRYAERLAAEQPGLKPTRSDAIRILLHKALDADTHEEETIPTGANVHIESLNQQRAERRGIGGADDR